MAGAAVSTFSGRLVRGVRDGSGSEKLADGRLTSHDDAALLDLSRRHVRRLQAAYRGGGAITPERGEHPTGNYHRYGR